ncbi:hypothetical protein ACH4GK_22590 [Streptomyces rimosus]|uniref:hypothetical protein n=1 Tax=Streptomyces rimosus TaxID=1927 RepID=UPI00131B1713|nr:hypothetical protein [Streptomyces rimosus]
MGLGSDIFREFQGVDWSERLLISAPPEISERQKATAGRDGERPRTRDAEQTNL